LDVSGTATCVRAQTDVECGKPALRIRGTPSGRAHFDQLLARRLDFVDGSILVPPESGHGIELDMDAVRHYEAAAAS
jgi:L-alanine-DL-glutamate epimerase-like enolase superfamily enzyme